MLLHNIGENKFAATIAVVAIFDADGKPPELDFDALLVKVVDHLAHGIGGESVGARKPISIVVVPAIVEGSPVNAEVL